MIEKTKKEQMKCRERKNITQNYLNQNTKHKTLISNPSAITLIALIITIIVMLILVGVTVSVAINGGLFANAKQATTKTQLEADKESLLSAVIGAMNDKAEIDFAKLNANLPDEFIESDGIYTSKKGNTFYVDEKGNIITAVQVTCDGETVMLTPKNVGQYLGKVVTNYQPTASSVTIGEESYIVSTKYRLYYIDFNNKYKDGAGTIYLKAECTDNKYKLPTDATESTAYNIKIRNLNPELYKGGVTSPNANNNNMKAVTWVTNTINWNGLKQGVNQEIANNINYIVGAPSLEMMVDSYNTHYELTESTPNTDSLNAVSPRVRLFYKYPYNSDNCGYGVGPSNNTAAQNGYYTTTSNWSLKSDSEIDSMYYPVNSSYWLSSPSAYSSVCIKIVTSLRRTFN